MQKIFFVLVSLFLASCGAHKESPVIYFSNASLAPINDIKCNWVGKNVLGLPLLNPGESRSQSFYMDSNSDFFGNITISWRNNNGERISREINFQPNNLPSISDSTTYNFVQLYLDQDELEITTSDAPDLSGKTRKMDRLLAQYKEAYKQSGHGAAPQSSLISVQHPPQRDNSVPGWLTNSY
ncbi:MAG: hypothetical protein V4694_07465 [Pseudomonadota bacterium]